MKRLRSVGSSRKRHSGPGQPAEDEESASSAHATPLAELPAHDHRLDRVELPCPVSPSLNVRMSRADATLDVVDDPSDIAQRWDEVQKHLLGKELVNVRMLQQRSLMHLEGPMSASVAQELEVAVAKTMGLMTRYIGDVRQAAHLPGAQERIAQARLLLRQLRQAETDYILKLQYSMDTIRRKSSPLPPTTNPSLPGSPTHRNSPEMHVMVRTLQDRQQDAKKRLTTLGYLWSTTEAENEMSARLTGSSSSPALMGLESPITVIAPLGDTILDFEAEGGSGQKFRVSSHSMSQVSPFFDYALDPYIDGNPLDPRHPPPEDLVRDLERTKLIRQNPPSPIILCLKVEKHISLGAVSTLLAAAHMRGEKVPRTISFQDFVEIASVCYAYRCTAPVAIYVERVWLEQHLDCLGVKGYEDFLFISFVFGMERIFEKTSKWALMRLENNYGFLPDESRLPPEVNAHLLRLRAVIFEKIRRVCKRRMANYMPAAPHEDSPPTSRPSSYVDPDQLGAVEGMHLKRQTRCPQRSHPCDAVNLGWLMLVLNEVGLLTAVLDPTADPAFEWPSSALEKILRKLCAAPSAPGIHDACDYAPAFRNKFCDLYNSIKGLQVRDVNRRLSAPSPVVDGDEPLARRDPFPAPPDRDRVRRSAGHNPASLVGRLANAQHSRLSQQSGGYSDGNTSRDTTPSDGTDLTEYTDDDRLHAAIQSTLRMVQDQSAMSVISTEVDLRTERCDSPTLTTASVADSGSQSFPLSPRLLYDPADRPRIEPGHRPVVDAKAEAEAVAVAPPPAGRAWDSSEAHHVRLTSRLSSREVVPQADKVLLMAGGRLSGRPRPSHGDGPAVSSSPPVAGLDGGDAKLVRPLQRSASYGAIPPRRASGGML
ncbi:MAG: hypothetical protein M1826_001423 [Phylliscum demangeonii]|nr:MAG: hypothetical protein M1826_001423 [Phylliscum demangeonii]